MAAASSSSSSAPDAAAAPPTQKNQDQDLPPNMKAPSITHGAPCWVAIPAEDVLRARKFYSDLFGWTYRLPYQTSTDTSTSTSTSTETKEDPTSLAEDNIAMIIFPGDKGSEALSGGIIKLDKNKTINAGSATTQGVVVFLWVESVDDVLSRVGDAGGKVLSAKEEEGKNGWMATVADTEGNEVGVYQLRNES
ncbi:MAG: hypothetical protein M1825_004018 [Sarcosagium campestre]|nr:MAG: hypothetical protein M1825_004018 [Sarcosagium campestre]